LKAFTSEQGVASIGTVDVEPERPRVPQGKVLDGVRIWFYESGINRLDQNVVVGSCLLDGVRHGEV